MEFPSFPEVSASGASGQAAAPRVGGRRASCPVELDGIVGDKRFSLYIPLISDYRIRSAMLIVRLGGKLRHLRLRRWLSISEMPAFATIASQLSAYDQAP